MFVTLAPYVEVVFKMTRTKNTHPMKIHRINLAATAAAVLATVALPLKSKAQSSDALIDKLVDKGILTLKEGNELRDEADKGFTSAYQVKSGMPDWVNSFKINGDFRGRFDGIYSDAGKFVDRNRFRYRLRFGMTAVIKDDFEVGIRLTSAESNSFGGDPISGNASFTGNGSKKFVYIDQAYGKWSPLHTPEWTGAFTFGKMENPFVTTDMIFDQDYTPEGGAAQIGYRFNSEHELKWNTGAFTLAELSASSNDAYLLGTQLRFDSAWTKKLATSVGVTALAISGDQGLATTPAPPFGSGVPNINRGNTSTPIGGTPATGGALVYNYNPIIADASARHFAGLGDVSAAA